VIGSDEELALTKAIAAAFPDATLTLCTKHLQENVKRHLDQKTNTDARQKDEIQRAIFYGSDGLCVSDTLEIFDKRAGDLRQKYRRAHPEFIGYFDNLTEKLRKYVVGPALDEKVPIRWTNNNAESLNHTIKQSLTQWRLLPLPDLVEELEREEQLQTKLLELAFTKRGDLCLTKTMRRFECHPAAWDAKTEEEKRKRLTKFVRADISVPIPRAPKQTLTSTDGDLTINGPRAKVAKKPGQVTRPRSTRTRTIKTRKCNENSSIED